MWMTADPAANATALERGRPTIGSAMTARLPSAAPISANATVLSEMADAVAFQAPGSTPANRTSAMTARVSWRAGIR